LQVLTKSDFLNSNKPKEIGIFANTKYFQKLYKNNCQTELTKILMKRIIFLSNDFSFKINVSFGPFLEIGSQKIEQFKS
jgi:hypothetical protein